ncbi:MAG: hypothetical protein II836_06935 [Clostridia bacterium]|nr:hypothetical protein [Clostridia bacterium]MBQ3815775.1 hypothetical protein [Clostridia bacterium]MBQ4193825.1 hypothetical protein [Clostridia bacterium]MBR4186675.1 hypothetical protein [Clostridia bacterium]
MRKILALYEITASGRLFSIIAEKRAGVNRCAAACAISPILPGFLPIRIDIAAATIYNSGESTRSGGMGGGADL